MNECETTRPVSKQGHRRIYENGVWIYEWTGIPENFNAWEEALLWDPCNDRYIVITREEMRGRREQERRDRDEIEDNFVNMRRNLGNTERMNDWMETLFGRNRRNG